MNKIVIFMLAIIVCIFSLFGCTKYESTKTIEIAPSICGVRDTYFNKTYNLEVEYIRTLDDSESLFPPAEGYEYVEVSFIIENVSNKTLSISSLMCFDAYVDNFATSIDFGAYSLAESNPPDVTLDSGKKARSSLCYELPSDWKELQIVVNIILLNKTQECIVVFNR